ncbi:MAG: NAD-dependent epimerase/dehydratase family protein [Chrysiogenetes bacterium]|nr:NAD-dependent epimerase/dehydratase family protein [Chrysiogenetes bacterium]
MTNGTLQLEDFRDKRVLVTGAAGFVGRHLIERLRELGSVVCALDRPGTRFPAEWEGVQCEGIDLSKPTLTTKAIKDFAPEIILHLAAMIDVARAWDNLRKAMTANIVTSVNVLEAAGALEPAPRVVLLGTSEEYGDQIAPFNEKMQVRPVSPYSWSKTAITHLAGMAWRTFGLPTVVLRPFLVYGPSQPPGLLLPSLIRALLAGEEFEMTAGEQSRDFVHVHDVVDAILRAGLAERAVGEIINVCSGREVQVREVALMIARELQAEELLKLGALPYRKGEAMRFVGDPHRARTLLGFSAETRLEDGIAQTIAWYRVQAGEG